MQTTSTLSPLAGELEEQPCSQPSTVQSQKLPVADEQSQVHSQASAYLCKGIIIVAGLAMMYGIIHYGQVYQNYLQW